jgi:hypothetical protein
VLEHPTARLLQCFASVERSTAPICSNALFDAMQISSRTIRALARTKPMLLSEGCCRVCDVHAHARTCAEATKDAAKGSGASYRATIDREWSRLVAARKSVHNAFARLIGEAHPQQSKQKHRKQRRS